MATKYILHLPSVLPQGWKTAVLEDIASFANGLWKGKKQPYLTARVLRNTNFNNDGTLDYSDIAELLVQVNQFSPRQLRLGDIILERSGGGPSQPVGRVVFFDRKDSDFSFSNFTTRVRVTDEFVANPKYLLYFLLHFYSTGHTNALQSRTTGIRNLMFSDYRQVVVPLPPLDEQRRIAAVLTAIQDAIAAQEDVIAAARAFKRSLMHRLFTYGPGRVPAETKETEIGEIPSHWEIELIQNLVRQKVTDGTHRTPTYVDDGVPFISATNLQEAGVDFSKCKFISVDEHLRLVQRCKPEEGDILLSKVGTLGLVAIVPPEPEFSIFVQVALIKPNEKIGSSYLGHCLKSENIQHRIDNRASQSTMKYIGVGKIGQLEMPMPPEDERIRISNMLDSLDAKIAAEEDRKAALDALFKSMLHQLMTGQIRLMSDEGLPLEAARAIQ